MTNASSYDPLKDKLQRLAIAKRRLELAAQRRETTRVKNWAASWSNPACLAIIAGLIGYLGTMLTWTLHLYDESRQQANVRTEEATKHARTLDLEEKKQKATNEIERKRLEGTLILDALKTGEGTEKTRQTALNLLLLSDAKLVTFDDDTRSKLMAWADGEGGVGPGLPPSSVSTETADAVDFRAYEAMETDAAFAVSILNKLFEKQYTPPAVKPPKFGNSFRNAYYDEVEKVLYAPPDVRYLPDITYHEVAHMYLPKWGFQGESGALTESLADCFASVVKQHKLKQSAQTADWLIGPKAIAWLSGEDLSKTMNVAPLRSLKAPGTAYEASVLGKDPQVGHMNQFFKTESDNDNGGVHTNSGIPNKAFYETAMKIGTERTSVIWVKAISSVTDTSPAFAVFCRETVKQAKQPSEVDVSAEILAAWKSVGVDPAN